MRSPPPVRSPPPSPPPPRPPRPPPPTFCAAQPQCCGDKCNCVNNKGLYDGDNCKNKGASDPLPDGCPLETKWCNCSEKAWTVGRYFLEYPIVDNYPDRTTGQSLAGTLGNSTSATPYISGVVTRAACCAACSAANKGTNKALLCNYWLHFVPPTGPTPGCNSGTSDSSKCGFCLIFPPGNAPSCQGNPTCATVGAANFGNAQNYSTVGKGCPGGANDPHFVGAQGTHFDWNGLPGQSWCLITDPKFQVNMNMAGYYDERTVGASIIRNGKAVRTWIKELGVLWTDQTTGLQHSLKLKARDGKSEKREAGYMGSITVDGEEIPRLSMGDSFSRDGGLRVQFVAYEKQGGGFFDVDVYQVDIAGLLSVEVKLRPAHPLLQTKDDAMTHINVRFLHVEHSPETHGVLGQTFRTGREQRAMDYTALSQLIGRDVAADSGAGRGFLDGVREDYATSSVLSSDCKYSAYHGQHLPSDV